MFSNDLGLSQDLINAVKAITEASCSSKKMEKEELHPNQKVLDKNKNGKIDAHDFKLLRAKKGTVEEEVEELDELSKATMRSYLEKGISKGIKDTFAGKGDISKKREAGLNKAMKKVYHEEVEELDELDKATYMSYLKKAPNDAVDKAIDSTVAYNSRDMKKSVKLGNKVDKRLAGISKATDKLTKEQVEEIEMLAAKHGLGE